mmetsp:Transcript_8498/g.25670  ORF Transcript_8498/g.25670 Transcript_8498/m.25670 type:complete len:340 (-) Transcript_8498:407-1426(-)
MAGCRVSRRCHRSTGPAPPSRRAPSCTAWRGISSCFPSNRPWGTPPRSFRRTFVPSMIFVGFVMCAFGSACVVAFGRVDDGSVTAFLLDHADDPGWTDAGGEEGGDGGDNDGNGTSLVALAYAINLVASLSLIFTYPLQLFPAVGLMGQLLARRRRRRASLVIGDKGSSSSTRERSGGGNADANGAVEGDSLPMRMTLVLSTYAAAMIVPHLRALIALAGAVTGSMTSLILPPLLAVKFVFDEAGEEEEDDDDEGRRRHRHCVSSAPRGMEEEGEMEGADDDDGVRTTGRRRRRRRSRRRKATAAVAAWFVSLIGVGCAYGILGTFFSVKDIVNIYRDG